MNRKTRYKHVRYVLIHGVLGVGMVTGMLSALAWSWVGDEPFFDIILGALLVFGIGGAIWGELMWRREHAYLRTDADGSPRLTLHDAKGKIIRKAPKD